MQPRTTITEFKKDSQKILKRMKKSGNPVLLTRRGKTEAVLQTSESYARLRDIIEELEVVQAIHQGMAEYERGETVPLENALAEIRKEFGIR